MLRTASAPPVLALLCALAACDGAPTTVHLTLQAQPGLNPDGTGLPNPVETHVFLLKNADTFSNTDYFQLVDKERTVLGADLLTQHDEIMRPSQTFHIDLPVQPGTKFVAVSASYRNIDKGVWRIATPLKGRVTISLGTDTLQLVEAK